MTSRRDFFRTGGLAACGGALLVAGCGGDEGGDPDAGGISSGERDVRLLNFAVDLENTAVAAYTAGAGLLRGPARAAGARLLAHEREHAAGLGGAIKDLGGTPNQPRSREEYRSRFPNLKREEDVLRFAVDLENMAIEAYLDWIPRLSSPDLRQTAAAIVANEAEHISLLLGVLNPGDPAAQTPYAFVTGVAATV